MQSLDRGTVMGVVNVTPDSFSDGGKFIGQENAVQHAMLLMEQGADILDIGGESTRPGAAPVDEAEELRRTIPVIEAIRAHTDHPISIDTSKPAVMRAAVAAGASMINDVCALQLPGAITAVAELEVPVCLMHMQGQPRTMQQQPTYTDVVAQVCEFLQSRAEMCRSAGVAADRIMLDPGFGFGKTLAHNLALMRGLSQIRALGYPVLAGLSRKRMIGEILQQEDPQQRLIGSVAAALCALERGADWVRVHDVQETVQAVKLWRAVSQTGSAP